MHALSFHTWVIHISSVLEWMLAIAAVTLWGERRAETEHLKVSDALGVDSLCDAVCPIII